MTLYCDVIGPASDDNELENRLYEVFCLCIVCSTVCSIVCNTVYSIVCDRTHSITYNGTQYYTQ